MSIIKAWIIPQYADFATIQYWSDDSNKKLLNVNNWNSLIVQYACWTLTLYILGRMGFFTRLFLPPIIQYVTEAGSRHVIPLLIVPTMLVKRKIYQYVPVTGIQIRYSSSCFFLHYHKQSFQFRYWDPKCSLTWHTYT